jgi:hypothetical protein
MEPASRKTDKVQREFEETFNELYPEQQFAIIFAMIMKAYPFVRILVYTALTVGAALTVGGIITNAPVAIVVGIALLLGFVIGILLAGGGFRSK